MSVSDTHSGLTEPSPAMDKLLQSPSEICFAAWFVGSLVSLLLPQSLRQDS